MVSLEERINKLENRVDYLYQWSDEYIEYQHGVKLGLQKRIKELEAENQEPKRAKCDDCVTAVGWIENAKYYANGDPLSYVRITYSLESGTVKNVYNHKLPFCPNCGNKND